MKTTSNNKDLTSLSRRQMLGLPIFTKASLATLKQGVEHEPLEDFKHDLEGRQGWVAPTCSAKELMVARLPVATCIGGVRWKCCNFAVHGHDRAGELADAMKHGTAVVVERHERITGYARGNCLFRGTPLLKLT